MSFSSVRPSTATRALAALAAPWLLLLAACSAPPKPPAEADALPPPPVLPRVMPVEAEPKAPATQPASLFTLMTQGPVAAVLAYADKMRPLSGAELSAEIQRLGDPGDAPTAQMHLAILLSQTRVPADLARALGLLQRDKQVQQLRDSQRRIDQLNDRIEALRAIERSFARPNTPAAPASAPNGSRSTP